MDGTKGEEILKMSSHYTTLWLKLQLNGRRLKSKNVQWFRTYITQLLLYAHFQAIAQTRNPLMYIHFIVDSVALGLFIRQRATMLSDFLYLLTEHRKPRHNLSRPTDRQSGYRQSAIGHRQNFVLRLTNYRPALFMMAAQIISRRVAIKPT